MKKIIFASLLLFAITGIISGQCKGLTKKKCMPVLRPYASNGKMSSAVMRPGDRAEVMITFNSGINYRLMLCKSDNIQVNFKVMDEQRSVFFDSRETKKEYFDFNVASTQQLIVGIVCEDRETLSGLLPEGCVSILTGYRSED